MTVLIAEMATLLTYRVDDRVIGQVVPCVVAPGLEGVPMLLVQPLDKMLKPKGKAIIAADATRMGGPGELVS
jgi:microcompartment protein CcmK/EutM